MDAPVDPAINHHLAGFFVVLQLFFLTWLVALPFSARAQQSIALANGLRRGPSLWSHDGQNTIASLPLAPHTAYRPNALQAVYAKFETEMEKLNQRVEEQACKRAGARLRMTHPGVGLVTALA